MINQKNVLAAADFQSKEIILNYNFSIACGGWKDRSKLF